MEAKIVRGRIRVEFPPEMREDDLLELQERIGRSIGSARIVDGHDREMSCALSVVNFRKLKALGCRLADDRSTREIVARMRERLTEYERETAVARQTKDGVELYQDYKFKLPPFDHQKIGFQFLHALKSPALFGDCGVGKTMIVLSFADSLLKAGEDWAFLVVCPVNLIKHVWIDDAAKFSDLRVVGLRESSSPTVIAEDYDDKKASKLSRAERIELRAQRRMDPEWKKKAKKKAQARYNKKLSERFGQDADMFVINPENMRTDIKERRVRDLCKRLAKEGKEVCLILDESSKVKSRTSRTYKSLKRIRALCSRCIIMTGTPSPNGILDLWAQFSVLDGGATLQPSFIDYRHEYCEEIALRGLSYEKGGKTHNVTKWEARRGSALEVHQAVEPRAVRFKLEDCIDLPPIRFIVRDVSMSPDQEVFYRDMEDRFFAELEGRPVTARVAVTKLMKLREVTGGFVRTDEGEDLPFGKNATKMVELDSLLEQSIGDKLGDDGPPLKGIIWAQYRWECNTLVARYVQKYGARGLFGGISSGVKDDAIRRFRTDPGCRLLVCHPQSAGHGLTLTEASYAFYYSMSYNFEEFYQSFRRITRPGQKRSMTFYFLVSPGTIDEELISAIRAKKNISDLVTDGKFSKEEFITARGSRSSQIEIDWDQPEADPDETV